MSAQQYRYSVSGSAPYLYPTDTYFAILYYSKDESLAVPKRYPYAGQWGEPLSTVVLHRMDYPMPLKLDMVWLSLTEQRFYSIEAPLPTERLEQLWQEAGDDAYTQIVVGMAPCGGVALWLSGDYRQTLVSWLQAEPFAANIDHFLSASTADTLAEHCQGYLQENEAALNQLKRFGPPQPDLYARLMHQFDYCYDIAFRRWNADNKVWEDLDAEAVAPELDDVEEALTDGTFDRRHDGRLLSPHQGGLPVRLSAAWHVGRNKYSIHFWFDDEKLYDYFYHLLRSGKDKSLRLSLLIDPDLKKLRIVLTGAQTEQTVAIDEATYQYILFKDGFEQQRSKNYNQPRGAWVW